MKQNTHENNSREKCGERVITFLRRVDAYNFVRNIQNDKTDTQEQQTLFKDFKDFLIRVNGMARNIPISKREFDGDGVSLGGFMGEGVLVPKQEDKNTLLQLAYDSIGKIAHKGDEMYMLPAVLNATHPFSDGNGRTSRILHLLMRPYFSENEFELALRNALSDDGRFNSYDINPGILQHEITNYLEVKNQFPAPSSKIDSLPDGLTRLRTNETVESEGARIFYNVFNVENSYCFIAMHRYLKEHNLLEKVTMTQSDFPSMDIENNYKAISLRKTDLILSQTQWREILDMYYELKKEHVQIIIDMFVHSDRYLTNRGVNFRDYFVNSIHETFENNKK